MIREKRLHQCNTTLHVMDASYRGVTGRGENFCTKVVQKLEVRKRLFLTLTSQARQALALSSVVGRIMQQYRQSMKKNNVLNEHCWIKCFSGSQTGGLKHQKLSKNLDKNRAKLENI